MATIAFRNEAQRVLFETEIRGQLSDGYWENARPLDHYKPWCRAEVVVDPSNAGRDFAPPKCNYALDSRELLEIVGERMVMAVLNETGGYYDMKQLRADLKDMKAIFKTFRRPSEPLKV